MNNIIRNVNNNTVHSKYKIIDKYNKMFDNLIIARL